MSLGAGIVIEERTFKASLKGEAFTLPTHIFVALLEVEPNHALTGTELESGNYELNYEPYARIEVPLAEWEFTAGTSSAKAKAVNKATITFATPTVVTAKRHTAKFFAICDAVTAGNQFYTGSLASEQVANVGGAVSIAAKALEVSWE